ncbi:DUF3772 domain-containing protein [Roseovarius nubinhibens]|uniref:Small Conductance Mechanosensitive Ion Channel n=1 Tax=Roseovarius nubinhibens (strain ATCC BAA-591 / DSM 15170 / ISM) TaxID=89187 RepID=A3SMD3_ROSNI|nr:DUF3772 domain-containing protein [Roseovarius nubinhibens]EAP75623.1 Small Conductance Mechanosensitive Ion Channel [Roseovarius nubinhibens ISM]
MIKLLRLLALVLALALPAAVTMTLVAPDVAEAQQPPAEPDYDDWDTLAQRADEAVEQARLSSPALEELRAELAGWRDVFVAAQRINGAAIETAQAQLDALGAKPEEGTEDQAIAQQRERLTEELATLRAPRQRAEVAFSRADGLIKSIDTIIRERQARELLELGPSPLNPANWSVGISAILDTVGKVGTEVSAPFQDEERRADVMSELPFVILVVLVGLLFMIRSRFWVERLVRLLLLRKNTPLQWLVSLLVSVGEIVVPYLGFVFASAALEVGGLTGETSELVLTVLAPAFFIFLVARWLSVRIFPRIDQQRLPLQLNAADRRAGRVYGAFLGLVIAIFYFIDALAEELEWSTEASVVILFPVIVVAGLLLVWLARVLGRQGTGTAQDEENETYRSRLSKLLARVLMILAVISPVLAAVGYFKAATAIMLPSLLSLMVLGGLLVVQRIIGELYVLATRHRDGTSDELVPVLLGFLMVLLSMPVFALIWGARLTDLTELWGKFMRGMSVGGLTISPSVFMTLAIVFTLGVILTRFLQSTLRNTVLPKTRMDAGGRTAVVSGLGYIGIFLSAIIAITSAGIDLSNIALVAGALSVGIGFGLQNIVSNFVSGIILLIERPISQGDWIEVGGQHGYVKDISVRSTRIETFDRSDVIVPNADLVSGTVTNYTRGNTVGRVIVPVGVAYGTDTRKVEAILREIAEAHPMVVINPPPAVIFRSFGADALEFEVRAILRDVNWMLSVHSDMNHEIARRFTEEGIEVPFAQRDLWLRNPETLVGPKSGKGWTSGEGAADEASPAKRSGSVHLTDGDVGAEADPDGDGR